MKTNYLFAKISIFSILISVFASIPWSINAQSGCTDSNACNYDDGALTDDGSCCLGICTEFILTDSFGDGWNGGFFELNDPWDGTTILSGTLDNVNDDGVSSNIFACIPYGCYSLIIDGGAYAGEMDLSITNNLGDTLYNWNNTYPTTFANYGILENTIVSISDDCSSACAIPGCSDPLALNYNSTANTDCSGCVGGLDNSCCIYPLQNDECQGAIAIEDGIVGVNFFYFEATTSGGSSCELGNDLWYTYTAQCTSEATITVDSPINGAFAIYSGDCSSLVEEGCFEAGATNANIQTVSLLGGTTYYIQASGDLANFSPGITVSLTIVEGECKGCTDSNYQNYDPVAVIDDGSCEFLTDNCTGDFDLNGTISSLDLSIFLSSYGTVCESGNPCIGDIDGDEAITALDLSAFLSVFGTICAE